MATTDSKVQELFKVVQKKKAEIAKAEKPNWNTNCSFGYDPMSSQRTNLQVTTNVEELVNIAGFILSKEDAFNQAKKQLGVETSFKWMGFTSKDWIDDIQTRLNKIQISKKKNELELLEARLNSLISPELKAQMELDEISKLLES